MDIYEKNGKVAYSTDIRVANRPKYVLLTLADEVDYCCLCRVADYAYKPNTIKQKYVDFAPTSYAYEEKDTWFIFDSMQIIPLDFLDAICTEDNEIRKFIEKRANNKIL